jgi:hypothetical protein
MKVALGAMHEKPNYSICLELRDRVDLFIEEDQGLYYNVFTTFNYIP